MDDTSKKRPFRKITLQGIGIASANILLFTASILWTYTTTIVSVSPYGIFRLLIAGIILIAAATWITNRYQGSNKWAVFGGSTAVTLMLITPPVFKVFLITYIFGGILVFVIFYRIYKTNKITFNLVFFFHISITLFILFGSNRVLFTEIQKVNWKDYFESLNSMESVTVPPPQNSLPDIYYIVVDGYGRKDVLQTYYGYDNTEFLSFLTEAGFVIPKKANVNYPKTALSIVSTLNMDYVPNFIQGVNDSAFWWLSTPFLENSRTFLYLESVGYHIISLETDWMITNLNNSGLTNQILASGINEFEGFYIRAAPLRIFLPLFNVFFPIPSNETHRASIHNSFKTLQILPQSTTGPKFVFAHIVTPHPPFVFDSRGNALAYRDMYTFFDGSDYPGSKSEYREGYIAQLQYTNTLLKETIRTILEFSSSPPIIIIQADHGPGMLSDFDSLGNTCLHERFSAFAAYYLPGIQPSQVADDMTPVNIFRLVLSTYVFADSANFQPIENNYFYPKDAIRIFQFDELTFEQVNAPCPAP
ncbi:MAG: hypothetical protein WHV44_03990 [Anaerolineales bacterium]